MCNECAYAMNQDPSTLQHQTFELHIFLEFAEHFCTEESGWYNYHFNTVQLHLTLNTLLHLITFYELLPLFYVLYFSTYYILLIITYFILFDYYLLL